MESIARNSRLRGFSGVVLLISTILILVNVVDQLIKNMCAKITGGLEIISSSITPLYLKIMYGKAHVFIHVLANPLIAYTFIIASLATFNVYLAVKYGCLKNRFSEGLKLYYSTLRNRFVTYTYVVDEEMLYYINISTEDWH